MTIQEAIQQRHSVRAYLETPLTQRQVEALQQQIDEFNRTAGLHIQLIQDEPKAFSGMMAHYGKFSGVRNYIAMIGPKGAELSEKCGYYGEKLVLTAQQLGLNTCWVALTYKKVPSAFAIAPGETLAIVIAIGHGKTPGASRKSKSVADVSSVSGEMPPWFRAGVEAALLAPTAMNQQKFCFALDGDTVTAKPGLGFYTKIDLGIAKCHFEIGAGDAKFSWQSLTISFGIIELRPIC